MVRLKAVRLHVNGGPEVLRWEDHELPPPGPGEIRVRHTAIAVNFSDINVRRGGFYIADAVRFPLILGNEAAGIVEEIGPGVTGWACGERVCYIGSGGPFYENTGAYAEARNIKASCLIRLPAHIGDEAAAAFMLKGLTALLVINRNWRPKPGEAVLIHGAAGGVGLVLAQWCKHLGATVIGTVGSHEKARIAQAHGVDHTILYREIDFVAAVRAICPDGVEAVLDGVGKDTFLPSLDCLRPFGIAVNYGNASGHPEPLDLLLLAKKGSLTVTRPAFSHHVASPADLNKACSELFDLVAQGALRAQAGARYRLQDAARAHSDLEARRVAGSIVLVP